MSVTSVSSTSNYYTQAAATGPVSVAAALAALKANPRIKLSISDTSANIERNFDALGKLVNNITQVAQTDASTVLNVTAGQWTKSSGLLSKFSSDYQLNVRDVTVANTATVSANAHVTSFTVTDNSVNISNRLDTLMDKSKLTGIAVSTPATLINVTSAQVSGNAQVLGKLTGNYGLAVSQASAEQAVGYASNLHIKSVKVLDSAGGISAKLDDLKSLGLRLKEVRSNDTNVIDLTATQVQSDALVIGKLYSGYQLSVRDASMTQAQSLAGNRKVVTVDIQDTAANISKNLNLLTRLGSSLDSIHVTDADTHALTMTSTQFGSYAPVLGKIQAQDDYRVAVTGANVSEAQTLLANDRVSSIAVADSSAAIAASLDALAQNTKLSDISQTGKLAALSVNYSQLSSDSAAIAKLRGSYSLNVNGVSATNAMQLAQNNSHVTSVSISDTGSAISSNLQNLTALGKRLTSITLSDASQPLNMSVVQWSSNIGMLSKISGGYSLALTGVSAAKAKSLAADSRVASVAVSDSAAAISAQLDSLHELGDQLTGITQTDVGRSVSVTATQWTVQSATLDKLGPGAALAVRNATAGQLETIAADTRVSAIGISDSSDNLAAQLDVIQDVIDAHADLAVSARLSGSATSISVTAAQYGRDADALAAIGGSYKLAVSNVAAADAQTIGQDGKVATMTVSDTGANLAQELSSLAALGGKVGSITQSDTGTALDLTIGSWSNYNWVLNKVSGGVRAALSEVSAAGAKSLLNDSRVASVSVSDSAAQISAHLDDLQGMGTLLTSLDQSDDGPISVGMSRYGGVSAMLNRVAADYSLAISGATTQEAQNLLNDGDTHVASVAVADSSANIAAHLDELQANGLLTSITQTGAATALGLTKTQLTDDADVLDKIQGNYSVAVSDANASDVSTLVANTHVSSMVVTDSASAVIDNLADLKSAGNKVSTIHFLQHPETLALNYAQWTGNQLTLGKIADSYSVTVSGVSASSAASLAADSRVASLSVSDSTARIRSTLDSLQALGSQLSEITVTDSGTPPIMTMTAAQRTSDATALSKIGDGRYTLAITDASVVNAQAMASDDKVVSIVVSDASSNIAGSLDQLNANSKLTQLKLTDSTEPLALSASLYNASTSTLAKLQGSYMLDIQSASVADASALQANNHVQSFALADTASAIGGIITSIAGMSKISDIRLTGDDAPITLTQTQVTDLSETLDQLQGSYRLNVTGVTLDQLDVMRYTKNVSSIGLSASSQDISENFDRLQDLGDTLSRVDVTTLATPIALTQNQWQQGDATLAKVQGNYQVALVDVTAENATSFSAQSHVATVSVADTAANISAQFDTLLALGTKIDSITVTDESPENNPIVLTQAQFDAGAALLDGEHNVVISG